ncbi:DUF4234 domain-containing protein [Spartinivicinus ruber]|uniref:DUF4234 domain-containing protein n=1 Tax=Spartinivicinus ruber TaxID=2683272 RepID=UPI0013D32F9F|nr:DUF4234 domain-containing protein [Spartinivicinus ruber]
MSVDQSPYAVPNANLVADSSKDNGISQLPRFSAWGVFFLTLITLGIYYYIWMYKRTKVINTVCNKKIPTGLTNTAISLYIINFLMNIYIGAVGEGVDSSVIMVENIISIVAVILSIIWLYTIRNRLHVIENVSKDSKFWIGGILTFFFSTIYLQYKINQMIDEK